ncbi:Retrovirus-related Pol polyprotein from transposon 17.6 [Araneus ventricosus]|uniref:RNA-directed DNA polymerase n=1 Tax=Araneus ventricosus TaxID=182803 RepID=A0A4Y2T8I5_ARAVE|nr:Retrovirus-related Pol polyprotein from transposon 17.6 [Araneus ventricosus]
MMQFEPREISLNPHPQKGTENRAYPTLNQKRYIKAKCPSCTPREKSSSNSITLYTCHASASPTALLDIRIGDTHGRVCADTGATRSIAGELMFNSLRERGGDFQKMEVTMALADGSRTTMEAYTAPVSIDIEGRTVPIEILALPKAKGNRTLLGTDFLEKSGIALDLKNKRWYFSDKPHHKKCFKEVLDVNSLQAAGSIIANSYHLREDEGTPLTPEQREKLSYLLEKFDSVFKPGVDPTPYAEHYINTEKHPPVSVPPYRMTPMKKELLRKEIEDLLEKDVIEECESAYGAAVVLIPKPDEKTRLYIDYRKLNKITVPDSYPLPRIDDLLQSAKHTTFMSTIDLKSGYHQINVHPADRDKTAFVCPFGTFRFKRMPFGLRNAPAPFQRIMDMFCPDLPAMAYLDDIIVLSPTFDKHLLDITSRGIEVDPDKVSAVQKIPPPRNVKQVQSFLQTCSWYRKFIPNFSEIARSLSNLTKKKIVSTWTESEQNTFNTLKNCLVSPPILSQADFTKPFVLRTDASNYALGAVLLQGAVMEEHPIEYASRLLNSAERNYSTTEREALAVVWALNKFKCYI